MSGPELRHPESDLLLRFLDGELSWKEARRVRRHVEACWQCRAELDELQRVVTECVHYREDVAQSAATPPKPWADLLPELRRLDEPAERGSFFHHNVMRWALLGAGAASLVAATLALHVIDFHTAPANRVETRPAPKEAANQQQASPASTAARADGRIPSVPGRALPPEPARETPAASVADELRAVAALHRLGADLGEPVEVARNGAHVVVSGTGVAPDIQRQIREAFVAEPKVILQFSEPPAVPPAAAAPSPDGPPKAVQNTPNSLEAQVGGRAQLERLSGQLLDHDDAAMARVYALRRLAEQFPPQAERQLSPDDQRLLKGLARQHIDSLAREAAVIGSTFSQLAPAPGTPTGGPAPALSWQSAVQNLFVAARRVETLLPAWLGITTRDSAAALSGANLPQQLAMALAQLQADVQQCELLLKP